MYRCPQLDVIPYKHGTPASFDEWHQRCWLSLLRRFVDYHVVKMLIPKQSKTSPNTSRKDESSLRYFLLCFSLGCRGLVDVLAQHRIASISTEVRRNFMHLYMISQLLVDDSSRKQLTSVETRIPVTVLETVLPDATLLRYCLMILSTALCVGAATSSRF